MSLRRSLDPCYLVPRYCQRNVMTSFFVKVGKRGVFSDSFSEESLYLEVILGRLSDRVTLVA